MRTLLVVDLQNDFMPFGALPVPDGDATVAAANRLMPAFDLVIATQDWHPANHGSFASNHPGMHPGELVDLGGVQQVLWPDHCVQSSPGASFHSALEVAHIDRVVRKGADERIDSYSGFFDNAHGKHTGLEAMLRDAGATELWLLGLATDYCVKYTALDGVALGFQVNVVADACRAVELQAGDGDAALVQMRAAGCRIVRSDEVA